MKTYSWVYLCNNADMLRLALMALPEAIPYSMTSMLIVVNKRNEHLVPDFKRIVAESDTYIDGAVDSFIVTDDILIERAKKRMGWFPDSLRDYVWSPCDTPNCSLGIKLLLPLAVSGAMLYTDDDVMILRDPYRLIQDGPFCTGHHFNSYGLDSTSSTDEVNQFASAMGLTDFTTYDYNQAMMDAGIWFVDQRDDWHIKLHKFFSCPIINSMRRNVTRFRCLDQRFITLYGALHGWRRLHHNAERLMVMQKPDKAPKLMYDNIRSRKYTFVHYGASTWKPHYITQFMEALS